MDRSSRSIGSLFQHSARPAVFGLMIAATPWLGSAQAEVQIGNDNNNFENEFVQPSPDDADQSLQNGDSLVGTRAADVQIGLLGIDILQGGRGRDVQIGGPDPGPPNNDRAFGGPGTDVFLWQPGDGSDFFDGGRAADAVVFGLITNEGGVPLLDADSGLPEIDSSTVAGFCEVVDGANQDDAEALEELGLDHLVRFFSRGQDGADDVLRVTLHLVDVEFVVCGPRVAGDPIEVFDLRVSPPEPVDNIADIENERLRTRLQDIVI